MNESRVTLRPADAESLGYVERLLVDAALPTADVRANPAHFFVGYASDERVGIGGIERYGKHGLLRSVVVEPSLRDEGYGTALCDALEGEAAERGVEALYLLTTTAAGFFGKRGYVEVERAAVPEPIRETAEFADLCPSTATCMARSL